MVNFNIGKHNLKPVNHTLTTSTFTVPSDEIWDVTLIHTNSNSGNNRIYVPTITDEYAIRMRQDYHSYRIVLEGGDEIYQDDGGTAAAFMSGYDVSNVINNEVVNEVVDPGDSVTVPSGETWEVDFITTTSAGSGYIEVNGTRAVRLNTNSDSYQVAGRGKAVFVEGDTITHNASGSERCWLSGYRVE